MQLGLKVKKLIGWRMQWGKLRQHALSGTSGCQILLICYSGGQQPDPFGVNIADNCLFAGMLPL